jgi:uncharacterized protein YecT (DUF1311 family)
MISTLILAAALQGSFDERARDFHCDDPQNQMEMNVCAGIDFDRADAELNAVWREAITEARARDREINRQYDQRPTTEAKLREAQRAWIVFRDAHCTVQGYEEARGGTMEPMVYGACRAALTRERIAQLRGPEQ